MTLAAGVKKNFFFRVIISNIHVNPKYFDANFCVNYAEKSVIKLDAGVNPLKLFLLSKKLRTNKPDCLSLAQTI